MKRFLITAFLLLFLLPECFELNAQNNIQGGMTINTTTVYQKKKKELAAISSGFEQSLTLDYISDFYYCYRGGIDYIAGLRFNKWLYAGVGLGLNFQNGEDIYYSYDEDIRPKFTIPLYLHAKAYVNLANKRYAPFVALSAGANITGPVEVEGYRSWYSNGRYYSETCYDKYNPSFLFIEPAIGLNYRLTSKFSAYVQLGLNVHGVSNIDYFDSSELKVYCYNESECEMSLRLGFVF